MVFFTNKVVAIHTADEPWVTDYFRCLIGKRQRAFMRGDKCEYKPLRNEANRASASTRTVLDMEVEGVRPTGRPKLRYMDTTSRDMKKNWLTDVNFLDRKDWIMTVSRATH